MNRKDFAEAKALEKSIKAFKEYQDVTGSLVIKRSNKNTQLSFDREIGIGKEIEAIITKKVESMEARFTELVGV